MIPGLQLGVTGPWGDGPGLLKGLPGQHSCRGGPAPCTAGLGWWGLQGGPNLPLQANHSLRLLVTRGGWALPGAPLPLRRGRTPDQRAHGDS
jgi:hypothetical protein